MPNGKIDYKKLLEFVKKNVKAEMESPITNMEKLLLSIWQEVLNKEEISISENFLR